MTDLLYPLDTPPQAQDNDPIMVLLIDDQAMVGEAIRRMLVNIPNIDFHYCSNAEQALQAARLTQPTVILQDLVMPDVDGLMLLQQFRSLSQTRDVPIIVLSSRDDPKVKSAAFSLGANDYLVKLPDSIELIARIRYHSRSYLHRQQRDEAYRALRESQQKLLEVNLELQQMTHSDGLTGLANRRYLDEYLYTEWQRATRDQQPFSLLMMDIDAFKQYNDTYGHLAGDEALRQVAATIRAGATRATDLAARFGGEEFALVLPATSPGGARLIAEKIRLDVERMAIPHCASPTTGSLTLSIGVATLVPQRDQPVDLVVELGDQALYQAKHEGRNRVVGMGE